MPCGCNNNLFATKIISLPRIQLILFTLFYAPAKTPLFFFFLPLFLYHASAQIINIDKTDTSDYAKKADWNASVSLGLEVDKQKSAQVDASNYLDASLQKYRRLYILSASNRFTYNGY